MERMKIVKITTLTCKRCGHQWAPRKPIVLRCGGCKSPYWNTEPPRKKEVVNHG